MAFSAKFVGFLVLVLAIPGITFGQRKQGRHVAAGTETKTSFHFDCPEEFGYYPHPADCTQYYVCVFGGALLESCTGGLMYSHELQTCDWPRNVGCDGSGDSTTPSQTHSSSSSIRSSDVKVRYTHSPPPPPPPPVQPAAVVTSRGQPRQLHHTQQEIIKKKQHQQQLYEDAEDSLPPAEEIESDRQQRVYRGQPSTIGQVQQDRDGLRHHTNAIPLSSGRGENVEVVSFRVQPQFRQNFGLSVGFSSWPRFHSRYRLPVPLYSNIHNLPVISQTKYKTDIVQDTSKHFNRRWPYHSKYSQIQFSEYAGPIDRFNSSDNNVMLPKKSGLNTRNENQKILSKTKSTMNKDQFSPSLQLKVFDIHPLIFPAGTSKNKVNNQSKIHSDEPGTIYAQLNKNRSIPNYNKTSKQPENEYRESLNTSLNHYDTIYSTAYTNPSEDVKLLSVKQPTTRERPTVNITNNDDQYYYNDEDDDYYFDDEADIFESPKKDTLNFKQHYYKGSSNKTRYNNDYVTRIPEKSHTSTRIFSHVTGIPNSSYKSDLTKAPRMFNSPNVRHMTGLRNADVIHIDSIWSTKPTIQDTSQPTSAKFWYKTNDYKVNRNNKNSSRNSRPVEQPIPSPTPEIVYNRSQHYDSSRYDPYYALYDDDIDLYKDVEYTQHFNDEQSSPQNTYRGTPAPLLPSVSQDKTPKRGSAVYVQNTYSTPQDIYQSSAIQSFDDDTQYKIQDEDQNSYQQTSKQNSRGERIGLNYIEDSPTTKRITSTSSTTVTTPQQYIVEKDTRAPARSNSNEVQPTQYSLLLKETDSIVTNSSEFNRDSLDPNILFQRPVVSFPTPFGYPDTNMFPSRRSNKSSQSTSVVSSILNPALSSLEYTAIKLSNVSNDLADETITPTTFAPYRVLLKNIFTNIFDKNRNTKEINRNRWQMVNAPTINNELWSKVNILNDYEEGHSTENSDSELGFNDSFEKSTLSNADDSTITTQLPYHSPNRAILHKIPPNLINSSNTINPAVFNTEAPSNHIHYHQGDVTQKPFLSPGNTSHPVRVSRINAALKSVIQNGRQQNCKNCGTNRRGSNRGRGASHYSSVGPSEPSNNVNRGTPAMRSRPTLKPSTSIVSKAAEFIDIYRNPPRRAEPIYPQPQPDKTAAKCRRDVCLLPDCSCGGKDIPGDIPTEEVPQIVLLTFDDAVNDLNMAHYKDLFEVGRVNPNGCPITATFYVSHEWTDYTQVQNLYVEGHEMASHTVSHSFGEQFSQKKWTKEVAGQREILAAYGGVRLEDIRGMRAPFLSVGGNKMFKMLYDSNFTYDSSMPIYENKPPSWPYTLDYKLFHDCMIPPCPTRSYPGVWEVPMVMWQDLNGGRCSMGDACSNPAESDGVFKMLMKNFERHYTTNRAPFGLFYHAAWFTQPHHKKGFIQFLDTINSMKDVWLVTNWQALQWVRDPTPISRLSSFQPFGCNYPERPKRCNNPKVCNLWHKTGVRYMRTCQPCPDIYPWTGNTGIRSSRIDNDIEE